MDLLPGPFLFVLLEVIFLYKTTNIVKLEGILGVRMECLHICR